MERIIRVLRDEQGIETLEWIVVGALVVAVGVTIYTGILQEQLVAAVGRIGQMIAGL
jgi:hypothetical protein